MKKIITTILLSTLSLGSLSQGTFNMTIPQPDFLSNDWDGDGEINSVDTDDDNDGILDVNDDIPFSGNPGGSSTSNIDYIESFTIDKHSTDSITYKINWNISEYTAPLYLYGGSFGTEGTIIQENGVVTSQASSFPNIYNQGIENQLYMLTAYDETYTLKYKNHEVNFTIDAPECIHDSDTRMYLHTPTGKYLFQTNDEGYLPLDGYIAAENAVVYNGYKYTQGAYSHRTSSSIQYEICINKI
jgi:hypothetical protein